MSERKLREKKHDDQVALTFKYYEQLDSILRDLRNIDQLVPRETSRYGCLLGGSEEAAIIEARKTDLLRYVQMICRDHIRWGDKLLRKGWESCRDSAPCRNRKTTLRGKKENNNA